MKRDFQLRPGVTGSVSEFAQFTGRAGKSGGACIPLGLLLVLAVAGCQKPAPTTANQSQASKFRQADRGEALLSAAARQLSNLPAAVDTELRPPVVVLDATKIPERTDVVAVCTANPNEPGGPFIVVSVPGKNSHFRTLGVRSGDILKFFIREDQTIDEERRTAGFSKLLALEFTVAQVIDDNTLLIETGVPTAAVKDYLAYMARVINDPRIANEAMVAMGLVVPAKIEVWRNVNDRLRDIKDQFDMYVERRLPSLGWEPAPDQQVLTQVLAWLNQWLRQSLPKTDWQRDPLLETLDSALLTERQLAPFLDAASLTAEKFQPYNELQPEGERTMHDSLYDGRLLQEATWLRDIARWAHGNEFDEVARATALFDWTVRNIQLEPDEDAAPHRPWQVLAYGRGTAEQRAWVFALLCRQQKLDVVMLAVPAKPNATFWLPALMVDKQLYLFDTRLGLPIPGPDGKGVATLEQVRKDDALLRQLDLENAPYLVSADALKEVEVRLVADPFDLTRRAQQMQENLSGDDRLILSVKPRELAAGLKGAGLTRVNLWDVPFRTLIEQLNAPPSARRRDALAFEPFAVRPVLWKARTFHFQGRRRAADQKKNEDAIDDHAEAAGLYTSKSVRPTDRDIAKVTTEGERRVESAAKLNATYWIGLLLFDDGKYPVAAHWLSRPELTAAGSPWLNGAHYNLARALESQGKLDEAIKLLEEDKSPQQHGNKLRARVLKKQLEESKQSK